MHLIRKAALFLFAAVFVTFPLANAQETTATIAGTVNDASGAPVPGATLSFTTLDRNIQVRSMTADSNGNYSAPLLPVGKYSVAVEAKGFKTSVKKDITLNASDSLTINFKLEVGDVKETVTVEAAPFQVQLQHGSVQSNTINGTQIRELALVTRNYEQLVQLMPGVSSASVDQLYVGNSLPSGQTATIPFAINGARNSMNAWLVDGADNVDRGSNQTLLNTPSIDAIAEFTVQRSGFSAESGRAGGAMIQVITKSGTSQFHGDVYEFVRNSAFAANNFYNNATIVNPGPDGKAQVAPLHYNDFGWTLGGPLFIPKIYPKDKTKTFFFFSQEFRRVIQYATGTATLPTTAQLNGAFTTPVCVGANSATCTTGTQLTSIDPVAKEYIKDIFSKLPLSPTSNTVVSQFRNVYNFEQELYKIDHVFGPKLAISARFLRDQIPTTEPQGLFTASPIPGVPVTNTNSPGHQWTFKATSSFTPTFLNEIGYNYSFGAIISDPTGLINSNISTDIKSTLPFPVTISQVPGLSFTGGTTVTGYGPYRDYNRDHNAFDNLTKIWHAHTFKFGGSYNRYQKTENAAGANAGSFAFTSATGTTPTGTGLYAQAWANFLTGNVATFSQTSLDITPDIRANQFELYAQDSWRVRSNFTVDFGVRYSNFRQPIDAKHEMSNFYPTAFSQSATAGLLAPTGLLTSNAQNYLNGIIIGGQNSPFGDKVSNQANGNFAPRFGFAWDPFGKQQTSIRGGYGIFYDATLYGSFEQNIFANPPFVNAVSISNVTLDNPAAGSIAVSNTPKALHGTPTDFKTPYMQQWSLEIDHQINPNTLFTVAYVGTKGTHLLGYIDINQLAPNFAYTSGFVPTTTNFTSTASELPLNLLRPYPGYNAINTLQSWFNSNYNALQTTIQKRFKGESQISANYTWSRNLTDNGSDRSNAPQSSYNFNQGEYGPATFDRTHVFNLNAIYMLPFFTDQKGFVGKTLGGWQASAIAQYNTGLAYTVTTSSSDPAAVGLLGSSGASGRPDLLCNPYTGWTSTRTSWFNTACFLNPAAGQHHLGTEGRGVLRGPGYEGWSIALSKAVAFGSDGRYRFVLRGEASNAFNHTNPSTFGSLNNTSTLFGTITGYRDPRIIQLSGKFYF